MSPCDGPFFQDQTIGVVGGGNTALEEADYLTRLAKKVSIVHRRTLEHGGDRDPRRAGRERVRLRSVDDGAERELAVEGVFIFIGFTPNRIKEHVKHDALGFFLTDERMETSIAGIFAVGDIRAQSVRQVTNAVADGTVAAIMAQKHIEKHGSARMSCVLDATEGSTWQNT